MISFVIFWISQVPFLYMRPNNLRWLFMFKTAVVPAAWIAVAFRLELKTILDNRAGCDFG